MIESILGTFIVLASYSLGYWQGTQRKAVTKARKPSKEGNGATQPDIKQHTPFSKILPKDEKAER